MAEQKTVIVLELRHKDALPEDLVQKVEARIYDYCNAKGSVVLAEARAYIGLEVRES